MANNRMFEGVRVIELAQYVFVPAAGALLADLGAEVIKIEMVDGDPYRTLKVGDRNKGSVNLSMEQNNRGKRSIGLNLKTEEGRALLLDLIETADIFLTSLRPGAIDRLGLGYDVLKARNERIIYVRGNGLGFEGDEADRAGFDASCFWARGGFAEILSPAGAPPALPRPALGDHAGAMNVAFGMSSALFNRERTGEGALVDISLLSSAMWILSADVTMALGLTEEQRSRTAALVRPLTSRYRTSDGRWILLMLLNPNKYWPELCERIGKPELRDDPRFATQPDRDANAPALLEELNAVFATRDLANWLEALDGWDAPWEVNKTIDEVARDPQAKANGYLFDMTVDDTPVTLVTGPVSFNGSAIPEKLAPSPILGADSEDLLGDVVEPQRLAELRDKGIVV